MEWRSRWLTRYLRDMGWTAVLIPFCVVTLSISLALSIVMPISRAKYVGVMTECFDVAVTLLTLRFFTGPHYDRVLVQYSDCIQNRTIAVRIQSWHNYCQNTVRNFLCRRNTVAIQSHCVRVWGLGYEISLFLRPYEIFGDVDELLQSEYSRFQSIVTSLEQEYPM